MKIYTARASQEKLKYYQEQIHYLLDGNPAYNWRKIQQEIMDEKDILSIPKDLTFENDKSNFKDLDNYVWLKSDFRLPILKRSFIELLQENCKFRHEIFPITIQNKKKTSEKNMNYAALYLKDYFDCIDKRNSPRIENANKEIYNYQTAVFKSDIEYPTLFKVKHISTPFMHFVAEDFKLRVEKHKFQGIDFKLTGTS